MIQLDLRSKIRSSCFYNWLQVSNESRQTINQAAHEDKGMGPLLLRSRIATIDMDHQKNKIKKGSRSAQQPDSL
ncbi:hypothetical protein BJX66DRAFT_69180 [Aspergillus keveii]|uniref:Uncharacterized protein n=1 Tax=Aspergillus keveii TaxID=714993 RepID=A0ABR4FPA9_9EURO